MAEIEHFCDPGHKQHDKFRDVEDTELLLYSACNQMDGKPVEKKTIGEAVATVDNFTLLYLYRCTFNLIETNRKRLEPVRSCFVTIYVKFAGPRSERDSGLLHGPHPTVPDPIWRER